MGSFVAQTLTALPRTSTHRVWSTVSASVAFRSNLSSPFRFQTHSRMSSSAPTKEWLVHIPDFAGALQKRLEVRPTHLANLKPHLEAGRVVFGGATLSQQPTEGQTPDMTGSVMLIKADSEEEVREWIKNDAYTKGGAWDAENAKIWPFKCAIRSAM